MPSLTIGSAWRAARLTGPALFDGMT